MFSFFFSEKLNFIRVSNHNVLHDSFAANSVVFTKKNLRATRKENVTEEIWACNLTITDITR